MSSSQISDALRRFIFDHIDSVELVEVILFLRENNHRAFTINEISTELRSSPSSVAGRMNKLLHLCVVEEKCNTEATFRFLPCSVEIQDLIEQLNSSYSVRRHKVLELIFSPMKKARDIADAFVIDKRTKSDGDKNG